MRSRLRHVLLLLGATFSCSAKEPSAGELDRRCAPGENLQICGKNLIISHRGGPKHWPEETLVAFEGSTALGVDVLELDVHGTKDGTVVCIHDDTVDRTTDGTGKVVDKTLAEIKALDAGHDFTPDGGKTFPYRGKGLKVPTLEEVLKAFPKAWFSVEIKQYKPSIVDEVLRVLDVTGMNERVVVASFDDDTIRAVRAKRPKLATSFASGEIVKFALLDEEDDYVPPAKLLQVPIGLATEAKMRLAKKHGLRMHVWTIDHREDMQKLWQLGVHGIMTDDPVLLKQVTQEMGRTDKGN